MKKLSIIIFLLILTVSSVIFKNKTKKVYGGWRNERFVLLNNNDLSSSYKPICTVIKDTQTGKKYLCVSQCGAGLTIIEIE